MPIGWSPSVNERLCLGMHGVAGAGVSTPFATSTAPSSASASSTSAPNNLVDDANTSQRAHETVPTTMVTVNDIELIPENDDHTTNTMPQAESITRRDDNIEASLAHIPVAVAFAVTESDLTNASAAFASLVSLPADALSLIS